MLQLKGVESAEVSGKRVLLRVDYNVPMEAGHVLDDSRMRATLPTISLLRDRGAAKIILATHLGRPDGKVVEELRTAPLLEHLKTLVTTTDMEMLENLRFNAGEEANDPAFAAELASHADVYINDAFAASHREHASIVGVAKLLPAYAGLLIEREVAKLSEALTPPVGAVALVAVTKADKITFVNKLATIYSKVLLGGPVPTDFAPSLPNIIAPTDGIPQRDGLSDIGPETLTNYVKEINSAPFVLWNGSLGWYEKGFTQSTDTIAQAIIAAGVHGVIGGGDTVAAVSKFKFDPEKIFISTGGGAMLDFLAIGTLPGLEVLKK